MFHTYPEGELPNLIGLCPEGSRTWGWIELAVQCSFFLITITVSDEDGELFEKRILSSKIDDAINLIANDSATRKVTRLDLMSPGYLSGQEGYRLDRITQVLRDNSQGYSYRFKLENGATLDDSLGAEMQRDAQFEPVISF